MHHLLRRLITCLFAITPLLSIAQQSEPPIPLVQNTRNLTPDTCFAGFQKRYVGNDIAFTRHMQVVPGNKGYIVAGILLASPRDHAYLQKVSDSGRIEWANLYKLGDKTEFFEVRPVATGGYIAMGYVYNWAVSSLTGIYVVRVDDNGNVLWSRILKNIIFSNNSLYGEAIITTNDGGFAITGTHTDNFNSDIFVIKLNATGSILWSRRYDAGSSDGANSITQNNDTLITAGYHYTSGVGYGNLLKISNLNGNLLSSKAYRINSQNTSLDNPQKTATGYTVQQNFASFGTLKQQVLEVDYNGNPGYRHEVVTPVSPTSPSTHFWAKDGSYVGAVQSTINPYLLRLFKVKNHQFVWKKVLTLGVAAVQSMQEDEYGNIGMSGYIGNFDAYVAKATPDGETGCSLTGFDGEINIPTVQAFNFTPIAYNLPVTSAQELITVSPHQLTTTSLCSLLSICTDIDIQGNSQTCLTGDTVKYMVERGPNCRQPIQWTVDPLQATIIATTDSTVSLRFLQTGNVMLRARQQTNCRTYLDSLLITVGTPSPVNVGADREICQNDTIAITATAGFAQYNWAPNYHISSQQGPTINAWPSVDTQYTVMATTAAGCQSYDTVRIRVKPAPVVQLGNDTSICQGSTLTLTVPVGISNYQWSNGATTPTITINAAGEYWLRITDGNNCTARDTLQVLRIYPVPKNFITATITECLLQPLVVSATGNFNQYLWSDGTTGNTTTITAPGTYWLQVTNADNCTAREDFVVTDKNCSPTLYFPTAFTPDGDGRNDVYRPGFFGKLDSYTLEIFSRHGPRVFYTNNPTTGWDGTHKGRRQAQDTYVWVCTYQLQGQPVVTEKGMFLLIR